MPMITQFISAREKIQSGLFGSKPMFSTYTKLLPSVEVRKGSRLETKNE